MERLVAGGKHTWQLALIVATALVGALGSKASQAGQDGYAVNLDVQTVSACVRPGEVARIEAITRLYSGGSALIGVQNIRYSINIGNLALLSFAGARANGAITAASSSAGALSVTMLDPADASNPFIPSTSVSDFGALTSADALNRPDADNLAPWDSDWVFALDWTVPGSAVPGRTYAITGQEQFDIYANGTILPDQGPVLYPGPHTPKYITICDPAPVPVSHSAVAFTAAVLAVLGACLIGGLIRKQARS